MKKFIPVILSLVPVFMMGYDFKHFWVYALILFIYVTNYSKVKNLFE